MSFVKAITLLLSLPCTKFTLYMTPLTVGSVSAVNITRIPSSIGNPSMIYPVVLTTVLNASVVTLSTKVTDFFAMVP